MAYLDMFTANLFRVTKDGDRVIAPFGTFGPTYSVRSDGEAERIASAVRLMYQVMLVSIIGAQIIGGWKWSAGVVAVMLVAYYTRMHAVTRVLPRLPISSNDLEPVSRQERQVQAGRALGARTLYLLIAGSATFVLLGVWMWAQTRDSHAFFPVAFFGLCLTAFVYQLIVLRRSRP
jgi:hypothetical protein